jgi:hypothetical protein
MIKRAVRRLSLKDKLPVFMKTTGGSITIEAAIILPVLLTFVLFMTSLIQIAAAELALRSAVTETGKSVAGYWEPVRMVYREAKTKAGQTTAGGWAQNAVSMLEDTHGKWTSGEEWLLQYEALLPDTAVDLIKWEVSRREGLQDGAVDALDNAVYKATNPLLCRAFEPILKHYANTAILSKERLTVESVRLPSLEAGRNPYVEITAGYSLRLAVPFWSKTIHLEKKSYERAWVGEE